MSDFDPAPRTLAAVTDPAWLGPMLATRWPGATVRGVKVVETIVTVATKVRLKLDVDGGGADVPDAICIKGMLDMGDGLGAGSVVETRFYREMAGTLDVTVPPPVYAGLAADGGSGIVVMRDVVAAGGRFCTALEPFAADEALDGLRQLARLHAHTWQGKPAHATPWAPRFLDRMATRPFLPQATVQEMLDGPRGEPLPPAIRDAARLERGVALLAPLLAGQPGCLVHGDAHAGNVYRQADGTLGIVDWQILQQGHWAQDVAYHLAATLTPETRGAEERRLVGEYLTLLRDAGGPEIGFEEAWAAYRVAPLYGYYLWAITRKVDPPIIAEFVRRLGLAAAELGSFEAVGA